MTGQDAAGGQGILRDAAPQGKLGTRHRPNTSRCRIKTWAHVSLQSPPLTARNDQRVASTDGASDDTSALLCDRGTIATPSGNVRAKDHDTGGAAPYGGQVYSFLLKRRG